MTFHTIHDPQWADRFKREQRRRRMTDRPPPKAWRFELGDRVRFWADGAAQIGMVRGRSEFIDEPDRYLVEFQRDGCPVRWWLLVTKISPVGGV